MAKPDLRNVSTFEDLRAYLEEELDWGLEGYDFDDLTFEYGPEELGLKDEDATKIRKIRQLRPLHDGQPWGIFFIEFERRRLPVVVLRRILSALVLKKRQSANRADRAAFKADDLLFITRFGEATDPEIAFAHFHQDEGDLPTLRVLGWDGQDTVLKLDHVAATLKKTLRWPDDPSDASAWREQWSSAFRHRIGHVIRTSDALAEILATLAQRIRDAARTLMRVESERGALRKLYKAFKAALIHDLEEDDFADTYAQTITYGLLTAAISRTEMSEGRHGTALVAENVADIVPVTNPFLKEMLKTFLEAGGRKGGINFDDLGTQDVVELLRGEETDLPAILRDFGNRTAGEDPVSHFYEHFLSAYNKKLKVQRGVFYTPRPVVSYIVRSVDELLRTEFGLEDGLASTVTWADIVKKHAGLKVPEGVDLASLFVQVLDPATGTATFLVEVIDVIHQRLQENWKKGGLKAMPVLPSSTFSRLADSFQSYWNQYVPLALLPRLHGYELMMAPYAIAHMKIGLKLFETGYRFGSGERARVYLTNALEPASDDRAQKEFEVLAPALAHEAQAVNHIKHHQRFTIIIGNPPYSIRSANLSDDARRLIEPFKFVKGQRIVEKGALQLEKNLNDDYVKFFGLCQKLFEKQSVGIVGLITNHAFLDNPTFRGFRWNLLAHFSRLSLLDLHGNSKKKEDVPAGLANENVFDIQQGVAISILRRHPLQSALGRVVLAEQWRTREEKYEALKAGRFEYRAIECPPPFFKMSVQDAGLAAEFSSYVSLTEAMPLNSTGIKTHRDAFVIDFDAKPLRERVSKFRSDVTDASIAKQFGLADTYGWKLSEARRRIRARSDWKDYFRLCLYRPFDLRHIYYHGDLVELPRSECMQHLLGGKNLALLATRQVTSPPFNHVLTTRLVSEMKTCSHDRGTNCFPLYLRADVSGLRFGQEWRLNFAPGFLRQISDSLSISHCQTNGVPDGLTPEDIFHYAYAVFHSPCYRKRYAEFLKSEFPRLPLVRGLDLFLQLARLGGELCALHLLESPKLNHFITEFVGSRNAEVEKVSWSNDTVWLNKGRTAGFHGIPEFVWNEHIGGYPVCAKWLKDRKGRTLSTDDITHYQKIVVALAETIRLMAEIDKAIEKHGGWPGAFVTQRREAASSVAAT